LEAQPYIFVEKYMCEIKPLKIRYKIIPFPARIPCFDAFFQPFNMLWICHAVLKLILRGQQHRRQVASSEAQDPLICNAQFARFCSRLGMWPQE
jgi:hypothetical protein